jgi:NAD(P)-dependent dehydrogenase (short-subunit alcohol dehydrogenase family)
MSGTKRYALVLGASSGFGAAICRALAKDGVSIFGVHLDRRATMPAAEQVQANCRADGVDVVFWNANAADPDKRVEIAEAIAAHLGEGTLVALVHSLAFGSLLPLVPDPRKADETKSVTRAQVEMTLDVMAHSLVYWTQEIIARGLMREGGRIFAMTSTGSRQVSPSYGVVSAAKAALEAHCRQLAYELLPRGITVNAICAGVTETPALLKIPGHEVLIAKSRAKSPIARLTQPEDVGGAVAALLDPRLYWMTGNVLGIHGGEEVIG